LFTQFAFFPLYGKKVERLVVVGGGGRKIVTYKHVEDFLELVDLLCSQVVYLQSDKEVS
jgi:hypothetical protein